MGLWTLSHGGRDVETHTPNDSMVFTGMAAMVQVKLEIERERVIESVAKRRVAVQLFKAGEPATQVDRDLGMSRVTL